MLNMTSCEDSVKHTDSLKSEISRLTNHKYMLREKILQLKEDIKKFDENKQRIALENASLKQEVKNTLNDLCIEKKITANLREENQQLLKRKENFELHIERLAHKKLQAKQNVNDLREMNKTTIEQLKENLEEKIQKLADLENPVKVKDIILMLDVNKEALNDTIFGVSTSLKSHLNPQLFDYDHVTDSLGEQMKEDKSSVLEIAMIKLSHTMKLAVILLETLSQKLLNRNIVK